MILTQCVHVCKVLLNSKKLVDNLCVHSCTKQQILENNLTIACACLVSVFPPNSLQELWKYFPCKYVKSNFSNVEKSRTFVRFLNQNQYEPDQAGFRIQQEAVFSPTEVYFLGFSLMSKEGGSRKAQKPCGVSVAQTPGAEFRILKRNSLVKCLIPLFREISAEPDFRYTNFF